MHPYRKFQLLRQIANALRNPNSEKEVATHIQNEAKITREFLFGNISSKDYENRLISQCRAPQRVILQTIEELTFALSLLNLSQLDYEETVSHELSHYAAAKQHGFVARFCITFYKTKEGNLWVVPSTQVNVSSQQTKNKKRIGLGEVLNAPKERSKDDILMLFG